MTPAMWYFMFLIFISFNTKRLFANGNSGLDLGQPKNRIRERGGDSRVMDSKPYQYENWISNRSTDKNIKIKIKTPHILSQSTGQRIITKMNDCISMEVVQSHNK